MNCVYRCACSVEGGCGHALGYIGLCSWCEGESHELMPDLGKVIFVGFGFAMPDQEDGH